MLNRYCVGCHNSRNPQPANEPVNLETANLDDLSANAATWERVLRKLSVRAMPPQGMPHPERNGIRRRSRRGWRRRSTAPRQGKNNPGRYVVHRLNRTEYGNAMRDLLALDVNVTELLPSDGGDFGFDNIATSLRTSPFLLERYLTAAQRDQRDGGRQPEGAARHDRLSDQPRGHAARPRRGPAARHARRHARCSTCSPPTASTSCRRG